MASLTGRLALRMRARICHCSCLLAGGQTRVIQRFPTPLGMGFQVRHQTGPDHIGPIQRDLHAQTRFKADRLQSVDQVRAGRGGPLADQGGDDADGAERAGLTPRDQAGAHLR